MANDKDQNEDESNKENLSESDDTFGLPEIEYEPINREEEQTSSTPEPEAKQESEESTSEQPEQPESSQPTYQYQETTMEEKSEYRYKPPLEEASSPVPKILGILFILIVAGGAAWFFLYYQPKKKAEEEKVRQEQLAEAERKRREQASADSLRRVQAEAEQRRLDSLAAIPKIGTIEQLSGRTGRYYVVVASDIDDDLLMDYAKKLVNNGVSIKIIPPFGKSKFFRLAIADGDSYQEAQNIADTKKADYGDAVWVLKY